jgi:hypothetical protein
MQSLGLASLPNDAGDRMGTEIISTETVQLLLGYFADIWDGIRSLPGSARGLHLGAHLGVGLHILWPSRKAIIRELHSMAKS